MLQEPRSMNKILVHIVTVQEVSVCGRDMLIHCFRRNLLRKTYCSAWRGVKLVVTGLKFVLMEAMLEGTVKDGPRFLKACLF